MSKEDMSVFKSFLRTLKLQLKELKKSLDNNDTETAKKITDNLIDIVNSGIED